MRAEREMRMCVLTHGISFPHLDTLETVAAKTFKGHRIAFYKIRDLYSLKAREKASVYPK